MSDVTLFAAPGACSRVTAIALNEAAVVFDLRLVRFKSGEHRSPAYLAKNPKGKIPTLAIDGAILTENVAILSYLNRRFPQATLLPHTASPIVEAQQVADLCFCSATLHPIVTRVRIPGFFAAGDAAQASVYEQAIAAMQPNFALVEQRLSEGAWWYGEHWSVMDAYLFWVWFRVTGAGMSPEAFPNFARHADAMSRRDSVQKTLAQEAAMEAQLAQEGLTKTFPKMPAVS